MPVQIGAVIFLLLLGSSETGVEVGAEIEGGAMSGKKAARLLLGKGEEELESVEEVETKALKEPGEGRAEGMATLVL